MTDMQVISGTRRTIRERVDGSLVVQVEIDPRFVPDFHKLFPNIDMPVALAPLVADFEQRQPEKPKGGELARLAGQMCNNPDFIAWCGGPKPEDAAQWIRTRCGVDSRAELDHDIQAAERFHRCVRIPFLERAA